MLTTKRYAELLDFFGKRYDAEHLKRFGENPAAPHWMVTAGEVLTSQASRIAELERDAVRYQWLRAQHWDTAKLCVVENPKAAVKLGHHCPAMHRLDDLIDSAIQGEKP